MEKWYLSPTCSRKSFRDKENRVHSMNKWRKKNFIFSDRIHFLLNNIFYCIIFYVGSLCWFNNQENLSFTLFHLSNVISYISRNILVYISWLHVDTWCVHVYIGTISVSLYYLQFHQHLLCWQGASDHTEVSGGGHKAILWGDVAATYQQDYEMST